MWITLQIHLPTSILVCKATKPQVHILALDSNLILMSIIVLLMKYFDMESFIDNVFEIVILDDSRKRHKKSVFPERF